MTRYLRSSARVIHVTQIDRDRINSHACCVRSRSGVGKIAAPTIRFEQHSIIALTAFLNVVVNANVVGHKAEVWHESAEWDIARGLSRQHFGRRSLSRRVDACSLSTEVWME